MKMHNLIHKFVLGAGVLALGGLAACTAGPTMAQGNDSAAVVVAEPVETVIMVDDTGSTPIDPVALNDALDQIAPGSLTAEEIKGLLFMREEEKLARDVYLTLYETWNLRIFQNIANSEATHMAAVKTLIDRYGLEDPAADRDIGSFTDPTLQGLYDQLVADGSQSLVDALRVGAAIEEIDILDLQARIAQTDKVDIQLVYENLLKGSRNHLRAFVSTLERQTGETYQPQYIEKQTYQDIVSTPKETGGGQGQGQQQRQGRGYGRRGN
jgi:hypothetical protein